MQLVFYNVIFFWQTNSLKQSAWLMLCTHVYLCKEQTKTDVIIHL